MDNKTKEIKNNMEWQKPYLVQILNQPYTVKNSELGKLANAFSFGCCGQESFGKEAMEMIGQLWSWEYMGAVEYEFGEAPKAMKKICDYVIEKEYFAGYIEIEHPESVCNEHGGVDVWNKKNPKLITSKVFILCHKLHASYVTEFIWKVANSQQRITRDYTNIAIALYKGEKKLLYSSIAIGGLNLDNAFIYLTYEPSIQKMIEMFGLEVNVHK